MSRPDLGAPGSGLTQDAPQTSRDSGHQGDGRLVTRPAAGADESRRRAHGAVPPRLRRYSSGLKRKWGIIQAFQTTPPLLILDEPTEGLDPLMQEAFYGLLADVKRGGATVFMSSHVLTEVERI